MKRRRKWLLLVVIGVPAGVAGYVFYLNRPDGFSIGPTSVSVEYLPASHFGRKPWLDFDLAGHHFEYPADTTSDWLPPGVAGSLTVVNTGDLKWRVSGVEYPADVYGGEDYAYGEYGNYVAIPYALSPERTHVELWVKDRWVPVTLPYEPGHRPPTFEQEVSGNDDFSVRLTPLRRLSTSGGRSYAVAFKGRNANLIIHKFTESGATRTRWLANSLNRLEQIVNVLPGNTFHWDGEVGEASTTPLDLHLVVTDRKFLKATLPDGTVIYDTKAGISPKSAGFDAIETLPELPGQKSRFLASQADPLSRLGRGKPMSRLKVVGYKFVRSTSFEFNLKNDETIQK